MSVILFQTEFYADAWEYLSCYTNRSCISPKPRATSHVRHVQCEVLTVIVIDFIVSAGNEENSINLRRGFHNLTLN